MIYLSMSLALAVSINQALYKLSQPDSVRPQNYATTEVLSVILDKNDLTRCYLALPEGLEDQKVHPLANAINFSGKIPLGEKTEIENFINSKKGLRANLKDFFPEELKATALTQEQMEELGYFKSVAEIRK